MGRINGGINITRAFGDFDYKVNSTLPYTMQLVTCNPDIEIKERQ